MVTDSQELETIAQFYALRGYARDDVGMDQALWRARHKVAGDVIKRRNLRRAAIVSGVINVAVYVVPLEISLHWDAIMGMKW